MKGIASLLLVITIVIGGTGCSRAKEKTRSEIMAYLEDKYDEKFIVDMFERGSTYQKEEGAAYPEGKPEAIFLVGKSKHGFYDRYPLAKWGLELDLKFKDEVQSHFPGAQFKTNFRAFGGDYDSEMINMEAMEYLAKNNDVLLTLLISIKTEREPDPAQYAEGTFNLLKQLEKTGAKLYGVSILFVDPVEDMENYLQTSSFNNTQWTNLDKKVYGALMVDEHDNITKESEIPQYYQRR